MVLDALLAFFHFAAIFFTVAFLTVSMALCRAPVTTATALRLSRIDVIYFLAAMAALLTGVLRLTLGVKGSAFYLHNPVFFAKIGVFVLIGALSAVPTMRFLRWKKAIHKDSSYIVPDADVALVRKFLHAQLILLLLLPLLAVFMARGIGA